MSTTTITYSSNDYVYNTYYIIAYAYMHAHLKLQQVTLGVHESNLVCLLH